MQIICKKVIEKREKTQEGTATTYTATFKDGDGLFDIRIKTYNAEYTAGKKYEWKITEE